MNLAIDFTQNQHFTVAELQSMEQLNEITFIVPVFLFIQNNFKLLLNYVQFLSQRPLIKTVIQPVASEDEIKQLQKHSVVLVRGTFDHLHMGHQVLLIKALFSSSHKLIVQVKDDSIMNNKKLKQLIQPIDIRKQNVKKYIQEFLKPLKPELDVKIQVITQPYGSAPYTKGIDAVVITEESIHSLKHINNIRKSNNGLKKVHIIIAPMMKYTAELDAQIGLQNTSTKISSLKIRQHLLKVNNFTLSEYLDYRAVWDSLVKEINALCRIKDVEFVLVQKWWERIMYKHSVKSRGKRPTKNNRQVFMQISHHNNMSSPNQHSLSEVAINLALLFDGVEEQEKSSQAVIRVFLQNLLKKKGKSKTCKKIRKMILAEVKEFLSKSTNKQEHSKQVSADSVSDRLGELNATQPNTNLDQQAVIYNTSQSHQLGNKSAAPVQPGAVQQLVPAENTPLQQL